MDRYEDKPGRPFSSEPTPDHPFELSEKEQAMVDAIDDDIVIVVEAKPLAKVVKATTCAQLTPPLGQPGCKRLPRHNGEHRATLTIAAGNRKIAAAAKAEKAKLAAKAKAKPAVKTAAKLAAKPTATVKRVNGEWVAVLVTAKAKASPVKAKPAAKVTIVPPSRKASRRRVGAPAGTAKRSTFRQSGSPRVARPAVA